MESPRCLFLYFQKRFFSSDGRVNKRRDLCSQQNVNLALQRVNCTRDTILKRRRAAAPCQSTRPARMICKVLTALRVCLPCKKTVTFTLASPTQHRMCSRLGLLLLKEASVHWKRVQGRQHR